MDNTDMISESCDITSVFGKAGAAADSKVCADIAIDVVSNRGGSAVDGAIAAQLCEALFFPHHVGIGGGNLMVIHTRKDGNSKNISVSSRERSPLSSTADMFASNSEMQKRGPLSIAVPGEVMGYHRAWQQYGKLPWKDLFVDAIRMAKEGVKVTENLAEILKDVPSDVARADPSFRAVFIKDDGTFYTENDVICYLKLAKTYERLAEEGGQGFYTGTLAEDILRDLKNAGAELITKADLSQFECTFADAMSFQMPNHNQVCVVGPPPSSGCITAFILKVMDCK